MNNYGVPLEQPDELPEFESLTDAIDAAKAYNPDTERMVANLKRYQQTRYRWALRRERLRAWLGRFWRRGGR